MRTPPNPRFLGLLLLVVGAAALLLQLLPGGAGELLWPFFVLVPGLLLLAASLALGGDLAALAIPGSIVSAIGAILLYQNATGRFETWSYAWGLIPAAVGAGLLLHGRATDDADLRRAGRTVAVIGLALFVAFGLFFELFVFRGMASGWLGRTLLPLLLIAGGALLLLRRGRSADRPTGPRRPEGGGSERPPA